MIMRFVFHKRCHVIVIKRKCSRTIKPNAPDNKVCETPMINYFFAGISFVYLIEMGIYQNYVSKARSFPMIHVSIGLTYTSSYAEKPLIQSWVASSVLELSQTYEHVIGASKTLYLHIWLKCYKRVDWWHHHQFDCLRVATLYVQNTHTTCTTRRWNFSRTYKHTVQTNINYKLLCVRPFETSVDSLPVLYTSFETISNSKRNFNFISFLWFFWNKSVSKSSTQKPIFEKSVNRLQFLNEKMQK